MLWGHQLLRKKRSTLKWNRGGLWKEIPLKEKIEKKKQTRKKILKDLRGYNKKKKIEKKEVSEKPVANTPWIDKGR